MQLARKIAASLLVLAIAFASTASAYSLFRCRHDAVARTSCCCPADEQTVPDATSISSACCCDVQTVQLAKTPSTTTDSPLQPFVPSATVITWGMLMPSGTQRLPVVAPTRVAVGPPLILLKQSFLI